MDTQRLVIPAAEEILNRYFPVLDHGFIALIDYMGGDLAVERAARCSYTVGPEVRSIKETRGLIRYLFRHRHSSPSEMVELTFHIGMPIFCMRQFVRHRMANLNEFSGRYSVMPLMFYMPEQDQVCCQSQNNKQGRSGRVGDEVYEEFGHKLNLNRIQSEDTYRYALGEDIARETARIDLPLSTYTYLYWKIDLRNLLHLIGLRSDSHAQWEIRQYSDVLAGIVQRVCPLSFQAFLDYQFYSHNFSQGELAGIRTLSLYHTSPLVWSTPPLQVRAEVEKILKDWGITGREVGEFWEKLKPQIKRDFSLDLSEAKDPAYFMDMVQSHSVEVGA